MGVYIKGMDKPKYCHNCDILDSCNYCYLVDDIDFTEKYDSDYSFLHPDCPLIEVKAPHGRLIDVNDYFNGEYGDARIFIDNAPTIIEAEVE